MKYFLLAIFLAATIYALPARASTYNAGNCDTVIDGIMQYDIYLYAGDDSKFDESMKNWKEEIRSVQVECSPNDVNTPFANAALTMWHAWLIHKADRDWTTESEKATQLLAGCSSTYFGTDKGAHCSNWEEQAIKWKMAWEPTP